MYLSVFDIFKIGIGPSSSHTVGPMRAARLFVALLQQSHKLAGVRGLRVHLYGSLAATGMGHATDHGILLGLLGHSPSEVDPHAVKPEIARIYQQQMLPLSADAAIAFEPVRDIVFHFDEQLPEHPNALRFEALDAQGQSLCAQTYFSVGGGFVVTQEAWHAHQAGPANACATHDGDATADNVPLPFESAAQLLARCSAHQCSIAQLVMRNELALRSAQEIQERLLRIWKVMDDCIERGCTADANAPVQYLPGKLHVQRRAPALKRRLHQLQAQESTARHRLLDLEWINLYAMAVNEENAAGGRVVTAPTNGAAGVVPAVLAYHQRHIVTGAQRSDSQVVDFLLTAAAIGSLYKKNASISGAEVGCQGEVGVACSMAAAGFAALMGATPAQVENAAEIGMEHNLGLTCDPVGGLVQIPCIERNAMGAVKAINAAQMALLGDGSHRVSLDMVIQTMKQTGLDMASQYKETSRGGLAVNVVEC